MAKAPIDLKKIDFDKLREAANVPPASIQSERQVLGAILLNNEVLPNVLEILKPDHFYDPKHQLIYAAILRLFENSEPVDSVSLYEELRKDDKIDKAGGAQYITGLSIDVSAAANSKHHARVVFEKWVFREIITTSMKMAEDAFDAKEDVFDILDAAESHIFKIAESGLKESYVSLGQAIRDTWEYVEAIHSK